MTQQVAFHQGVGDGFGGVGRHACRFQQCL
jgi:hypothetical protein